MEAPTPRSWTALAAVAAALIVGGALVVDAARSSSATYDEVAYLRIGAEWWRQGKQDRITRMGSPLTFWKLQQAPVLWVLDRTGSGALIDDPIGQQATLLPLVRIGSSWIWAAALVLTATWARVEHGPRAMAFAAWLFALSPNLIAHGGLATMEMPLVAATAAVVLLFGRFLATGSRRAFWGSAAAAGLAFSCKFTAVLLPPLLGLAWWRERRARGEGGPGRITARVGLGMVGFLAVLAATNVALTAGARLPLSEQRGAHPIVEGRFGPGIERLAGRAVEVPIPQDWAAFARQMQHQRSGGPGYLLGERRQGGWRHYYLVCLVAKMTPAVWFLLAARGWLGRGRGATVGDRLAWTLILGTLAVVALGSSRNYGFRYILFLAPVAIVWVSRLASWGRPGRVAAGVGLLGQVLAVAAIHPHELSYFSPLVGGPEGGKHVLADSNLDWGQGARALARLQARHPEYRDLTTYSFGDTDPGHYGVAGARYLIDAHGPRRPLPRRPVDVPTRYLAVSRSLQHGPWGPSGYFAALEGVAPVAITDDHTIAIYRNPGPRAGGSPAGGPAGGFRG